MLHTPPTVNIRAWFTLAVTAPASLLTLTHAMTSEVTTQRAAICAALVMALMFFQALSQLEIRTIGWGIPEAPNRPDHEAFLAAAFSLTSVEACSVLLSVVAGVPLGGQAIAVGLSVAAAPLALAIGVYGLAPTWSKFRLDIPARADTSAAPWITPAVSAPARTPSAISPWIWALGPDQVTRSYRYGQVTVEAPAYVPAPPALQHADERIILYLPRTWRRRSGRLAA
jgi:hypothetical protein